ncbi:MAG: chromosomal replication initiator protein DnaA [bacterium]|nr:chromosomal replication initiator protein DnaA [bacterium]
MTWKSVLAALKLSVSEGIYSTYLKPTELLSVTEVGDKKLICEVGCTSAYVKDTVEKRYWGQISQLLTNLTDKDCELVFRVQSRNVGETEKDAGPLFEEKTVTAEMIRLAKLKPFLTFDNYAVGTSNQMAYAAASAVSKNLGHAYNPFFIYGGVGVGKTHLMHAIGLTALSNGEDRILFCTSEEFTNDLVEGIRNKSTDRVRAKYRKLKLLLIDDIQFIAGRVQVQEEFFHTFNSLTGQGGQIVMTSDRPPGEISKLEERLRSRFGAGMIVDVGAADFELRTAVLLIKAKQKEFEMPIEIARLVAEHIEGLRELEGFLVRLESEMSLRQIPLSPQLVERLLNLSRPSFNQSKIITPTEVIGLVSSYYGVGVQQLKGDRRTRTIAWPRQILMHLLRTDLKLPLDEVGRLIGGRDHTTVMHADAKVKTEALQNPNFQSQLSDIRNRLLTTSGQAG